jgi:hypothetical protein
MPVLVQRQAALCWRAVSGRIGARSESRDSTGVETGLLIGAWCAF